jgi:lipopolysaccharide export system protein LptA
MRSAERLAALLAAAACLAAAHGATALESDRGQPVQIQADHAEIDRRAGRTVYSGNVRIAQGSIVIQADEVVLLMKDGEFESAVIKGEPATFEQRPEGADSPTRGSARTMTYLAGESVVELKDGARVQQGGDEVAGELIRYDVKEQRVLAAGGDENGGRVQMTITPRKPKDADAEPPPEEDKR